MLQVSLLADESGARGSRERTRLQACIPCCAGIYREISNIKHPGEAAGVLISELFRGFRTIFPAIRTGITEPHISEAALESRQVVVADQGGQECPLRANSGRRGAQVLRPKVDAGSA
jgi:hypothetical protein